MNGISFANCGFAILIEMIAFGTGCWPAYCIFADAVCPAFDSRTIVRSAAAMLDRIDFTGGIFCQMVTGVARGSHANGIDACGILSPLYSGCLAWGIACTAMVVIVFKVDACIATLAERAA